MKEQIVTANTANTAKLAKEKRFDLEEVTVGWYKIGDKIVDAIKFFAENADEFYGLAPTQSLLQKWLRDEHDIDVNPMKYSSGGYMVDIQRGVEKDLHFYKTHLTGYREYEEALEKGLQEALKLIK